MIHTTGRPLPAPRPLHRGVAALVLALVGALGVAMDPAQAIVDVSAVTLVDPDANRCSWPRPRRAPAAPRRRNRPARLPTHCWPRR